MSALAKDALPSYGAGISRVTRTLADVAGVPTIESVHVAEAIGYRSLERTRASHLTNV